MLAYPNGMASLDYLAGTVAFAWTVTLGVNYSDWPILNHFWGESIGRILRCSDSISESLVFFLG